MSVLEQAFYATIDQNVTIITRASTTVEGIAKPVVLHNEESQAIQVDNLYYWVCDVESIIVKRGKTIIIMKED